MKQRRCASFSRPNYQLTRATKFTILSNNFTIFSNSKVKHQTEDKRKLTFNVLAGGKGIDLVFNLGRIIFISSKKERMVRTRISKIAALAQDLSQKLAIETIINFT